MVRFRVLISAVVGLTLGSLAVAQNKSPADASAEAFFALRDDKEAKVDQTRLQKVMAAGLEFIAANPTHPRTWGVISALATQPSTMRDKKLAPLRDYWTTMLKFEVVNRRTARDQSEDQVAAWSALGAAVAGFEARQQPGRESFDAYRSALDRLAEQEKGARFVVSAERDYLRFLFDLKSPRLEPQLKKLLEGSDKKLSAMAKEEQNIFTARANPWAMTFTGLDGKPFDAAALRGKKALLVVFFSVKRETAAKEIEPIQAVASRYKDIACVGVALEGEEDRAAVESFVKSQRLGWSVHLGGAPKDNEFAQRLNVRSAPASFLFDKSGLLASSNVRHDRLEAEIKRVLGVK